VRVETISVGVSHNNLMIINVSIKMNESIA
jgi:hypothetical protein